MAQYANENFLGNWLTLLNVKEASLSIAANEGERVAIQADRPEDIREILMSPLFTDVVTL